MKTLLSASSILLFFALLISSCSKSNNLFFGRVEAKVADHIVIVTDCYRITVPPPEQLKGADNKPFFRYAPCMDADVGISGDQLVVNGRSYGSLSAGDTVMVDHGKVLLNGHAPSFHGTDN
jgi:hypothetical protein